MSLLSIAIFKTRSKCRLLKEVFFRGIPFASRMSAVLSLLESAKIPGIEKDVILASSESSDFDAKNMLFLAYIFIM